MCRRNDFYAAEDRPFDGRTVRGRQLVRNHDIGAHGSYPRLKRRSLVRKEQNVARRPRVPRGDFPPLVADEDVFCPLLAERAAQVPKNGRLADSRRRHNQKAPHLVRKTPTVNLRPAAPDFVRNTDTQGREIADGECFSLLENVLSRQAYPFAAFCGHKSAFQLFFHGIDGKSPRRKYRFGNRRGRNAHRGERLIYRPVSAQIPIFSLVIERDGLSRPQTNLINAVEIDVFKRLFYVVGEKFQHLISLYAAACPDRTNKS